MMKNYICAICGTEHYDLDSYLKCVAKCGEEIKAKDKQKRIEEVNAALNRVKQAKEYYEEQLKQFNEKYPEEYELNFGLNKKKVTVDKTEPKTESVKVSYSKKNDEDPEIRARVNGKDVSPKELFTDPDVKYLAELLGIIG